MQKGRVVAKDLEQRKGPSARSEVKALEDYNQGPLIEAFRGAPLFSHKGQSKKKLLGSATAKKRSSSAAGLDIKKEQKKPRVARCLEYFEDVIKGFLQSSLVIPDEFETAGNFEAIDDGFEASLGLFKGSARGKRKVDVNLDFYQTMFRSVKESDVVKHMKVFVACDSHFSAMVQGDQSVLTFQWERTRRNHINTDEDLFSLVKDMKSMFLPDEVISKKKARHPLKSHADYNSAAFLVSFQVWSIGVRFVQMSFLSLTSVVSVVAQEKVYRKCRVLKIGQRFSEFVLHRLHGGDKERFEEDHPQIAGSTLE